MEEKNKGGRPPIYTEKLTSIICSRIAEGESVRSIARDDEMPNASTIHAWVLDKDEFSKQYVRAKEIGAEVEAEEIEEIARDKEIEVQRAKLITDVKKWNLSKKLPRRFGDSIDLTTKGNELPTPIYGGKSISVRKHDSNREDISTE